MSMGRIISSINGSIGSNSSTSTSMSSIICSISGSGGSCGSSSSSGGGISSGSNISNGGGGGGGGSSSNSSSSSNYNSSTVQYSTVQQHRSLKGYSVLGNYRLNEAGAFESRVRILFGVSACLLANLFHSYRSSVVFSRVREMRKLNINFVPSVCTSGRMK